MVRRTDLVREHMIKIISIALQYVKELRPGFHRKIYPLFEEASRICFHDGSAVVSCSLTQSVVFTRNLGDASKKRVLLRRNISMCKKHSHSTRTKSEACEGGMESSFTFI